MGQQTRTGVSRPWCKPRQKFRALGVKFHTERLCLNFKIRLKTHSPELPEHPLNSIRIEIQLYQDLGWTLTNMAAMRFLKRWQTTEWRSVLAVNDYKEDEDDHHKIYLVFHLRHTTALLQLPPKKPKDVWNFSSHNSISFLWKKPPCTYCCQNKNMAADVRKSSMRRQHQQSSTQRDS